MLWQENIHDMLRNIPTVDFDALDDHFTAIDAKLTVYKITDDMSLLELALWKSKIRVQHGLSMGKLSGMERSQCHENCGACVIIPRVLPFLKIVSWFSPIDVESSAKEFSCEIASATE